MNSVKQSRMITDIEREYDFIRQDNARILSDRKKEIYEKIPEFKELALSVPAAAIARLDRIFAESDGADAMDPDKKADHNDDASAVSKGSIEQISAAKKELLLKNGYPGDYLDEIYNCPECRDTGYLRDEYGARRIRCACFNKKYSLALSKQSGLFELLETENFDNLSYDYYTGEDLESFKRAVAAVKEFTQSGDYRNFFFYGNIGTGKSFLTCCAAKELLDSGKEVLYYSSAKLFDSISTTMRGRESSAEDAGQGSFTRALYDCDLLILDDLGTEWFNSFVFSELFTLVNERIRTKRSTMISTNLTLKDLSEIYSERLLSRITSNYMLCKLTGVDIRMEKMRRRA